MMIYNFNDFDQQMDYSGNNMVRFSILEIFSGEMTFKERQRKQILIEYQLWSGTVRGTWQIHSHLNHKELGRIIISMLQIENQ
jgi:hypothetical protein